MLTDKEIEKERAWIAKEQLRIAEKNHPVTQPSELDEGEPGGFSSEYERQYKVKG